MRWTTTRSVQTRYSLSDVNRTQQDKRDSVCTVALKGHDEHNNSAAAQNGKTVSSNERAY